MSLKIALTHEYSWPEVRRGGERYLHELAGALVRRGHKVTIIGGATHASVRREEGVRVIRIALPPFDDKRRGRVFSAEYGGLLMAGRFDIVHSLGPRDGAQSVRAARFRKKRRTVYTDLGNPVKEWWDLQASQAWHDLIVNEIDVYGCLSSYALECLRRDYHLEGRLTPGGVRTDVFRPMGGRASNPTLLYSGVLTEPRKGVANLLRAFEDVLRCEPNAELWLSGPGDPTELLDAAPRVSRERTTVLHLGAPYDQPRRYSSAWATVLPSTHEAFGLVLIESLACGTPIVAVNDAATPELIEPGIGALAQVDDDVSLADACLQAFGLARQDEIRERCRAASLAYDWDSAVAPAIERVYLG